MSKSGHADLVFKTAPYPVRIVFSIFWVWMKELNIFDLGFGFCANYYPYSQSPRSKIDHTAIIKTLKWLFEAIYRAMIP